MHGFSARGLAVGAILALTVAVAPAAPGFARPADAPAPSLSASPDTNLRDGQAITVTGADFPAGAEVDLVQCVQDQGCDLSNLQVHQTDDAGGYTTTLLVRRLLTLDGGVQVDCAAAENCILVSLDISDLSTGAQTAIGFDPNSPFQPPLKFRVAPDPTDNVRVDKGVARITGTVHCNSDVEIDIDMVLTQVYNRQIFQSEQFVPVMCSHEARFSIVFRPFNGLFGAGPATVRFDAFGFTSTSYEVLRHVPVTLVPRTA